MKIEKWITYEEAADKEENGLGGMGGWFGARYEGHKLLGWDAHHRWKDYLDNFKPEAHPMLEELRRSILENKIRCTGAEAQNGYEAIPLWDNGKVDTYSMRAWGDLMAAVYSEEENHDYTYMDFYC